MWFCVGYVQRCIAMGTDIAIAYFLLFLGYWEMDGWMGYGWVGGGNTVHC